MGGNSWVDDPELEYSAQLDTADRFAFTGIPHGRYCLFPPGDPARRLREEWEPRARIVEVPTHAADLAFTGSSATFALEFRVSAADTDLPLGVTASVLVDPDRSGKAQAHANGQVLGPCQVRSGQVAFPSIPRGAALTWFVEADG